MTHLVEMQEAQSRFDAAGLKLYAISYDEQDALADFVEHQGITYTMLSDSKSRVIREYGILNTQVPAHQLPFYGIPFPGTYVIDEEGRVIAKFFPRQIAMRESAETFIDSALGELFINDDELQVSGGDDDVKIDVIFHGGDSLKTCLQRKVIVRFHLPEGLHIYGEPVPEGMVATSVEITGPDGLKVEAPILPPSETLRIDALDTELQVWSGQVDIVVPVWATDKLAPMNSGAIKRGTEELTIRVRYQACDDTACRIPRDETFTLNIPVEPGNTPRLPIFRSSTRTTTMPTGKHLKKMLFRGVKRRPWLLLHTVFYLIWQMRVLKKGPGGKGNV